MLRIDAGVDSFTFPPVIRSCASLLEFDLGREVHSLAIKRGLSSDSYVQTALIDFYSKAGDLSFAERIFDSMMVKDPIACNCLISAYSKCGDVSKARRLFDEMPSRGIA
ncbi:hypothetical protein CDL15_Pgr014734 [Punica granatum]|uniref:Pentatricopeptide repeat-containing protein n=1 Tax=Punica granatum TaxID=22663 RepID=A0A218Y0V3_PUNGR|nr:hypothetical protein CDL15_Pgr014734 [Punica granatum]